MVGWPLELSGAGSYPANFRRLAAGDSTMSSVNIYRTLKPDKLYPYECNAALLSDTLGKEPRGVIEDRSRTYGTFEYPNDCADNDGADGLKHWSKGVYEARVRWSIFLVTNYS